MHILVVEDEVRLARHVSRALTAAGHEVAVRHDGETALGDTQETRYELIVLDVMLPGIDGFEVLRRLRKAHVDSRVLVLTARGELNDRVKRSRPRRRRLSGETVRDAGAGRAG